jgi:hypothetical protein
LANLDSSQLPQTPMRFQRQSVKKLPFITFKNS